MRGLPSLRLALMIAVFALMGVPVWRLTRPASAVAIVAVAPDAAPALALALAVDVTFAGPPPAAFQLKRVGQVILQGAGPELTFHGAWAARLPKEGADLTFEAQWPPDAPQAAARVSVGYPDGRKIEKTFWAQGALVEVVTIPASPGEPPPS